MARYTSPTIELTGHVLQLLVAKQVSMKTWSRELILEVDDQSEPGEGPVKIEFYGEHIALLDSVREDDLVTVDFTIRGLKYDWGEGSKHSIKLIGQHIVVRKSSAKKSPKLAGSASSRVADRTDSHRSDNADSTPDVIRLGSKMRETKVPFPKAGRDEEPPF